MTIPIYKADAFTDKLFGGNPAAVCALQKWLPEAILQKIASENSLPETAFFVRNELGYELRWFTPVCEIDLCGHATLAAAHILFTQLGYEGSVIYFETVKAGILCVEKLGDQYAMEFPSRPGVSVNTPEGFFKSISEKSPLEVLKSRDYLLVYDNEEDVQSIIPDFPALSKMDSFGIIVTAPGREVDFVSRFFAPAAGIPEDPATGSSHCSLIPYWAHKLGKNKLHAIQLSERKGEFWCELKNDRVVISGQVVTYLKGEFDLS